VHRLPHLRERRLARQNPIPPSMVRWSRRWAAGELAKDQLHVILDEISRKPDWPKGGVEQQIGDYYASCMDTARDRARARAAAADARRDRRGRRREGPGPVIGRLHDLQIGGALRLRLLARRAPAEPGDRRHLRAGPGPARPPLVPGRRGALRRGPREVRGAHREDAGALRPPEADAKKEAAPVLRAGEGARARLARHRRPPRPPGDRPPDHLRRAASGWRPASTGRRTSTRRGCRGSP
jgi:hypothetical protein